MSRRNKIDVEAIQHNWRKLMEDAEYRSLSMKERGEAIGVSTSTISRWEMDVTLNEPDIWHEWKEAARRKYDKFIPQIDMAVIKKAQTGDVNAAQYVAQRFEGWSPKQINENLNKNVELEGLSEEELLEKSLEGVPANVLAKILSKKGLGAPTVVPEEPKKAENGG